MEIINKIPEEISFSLLETLYKKAKCIKDECYINGQVNEKYERLKNIILYVEQNMKLDYICDTRTEKKKIIPIDLHLLMFDLNMSYGSSDILDSIVDSVRKSISEEINFDDIDVVNCCSDASKHAKELCNKLKIYCERIVLPAGYDDKTKLFNSGGYHCFNIVSIFGKKYLIDCTYKQFFKTNRASLERLGVPLLSPPYPGAFMLLKEERKKVSDTLLKQGWIEATDENLKHYFDGFTLSFRNGLYYEKYGVSYDVEYTIDDYRKFIYGDDSQINHEDIEYLGFQKKPLKNHKLRFKK